MVKIGRCWLCGGAPSGSCAECGKDLSPPELEGKICFMCGHKWDKD